MNNGAARYRTDSRQVTPGNRSLQLETQLVLVEGEPL
jgi:hypothetical protein